MRPLGRIACLVGAASLVGGCSSVAQIVQRQDAASTETTLAAAGFHIHSADTAERVAELDTAPRLRIVAQKKGKTTVYVYADPVNCHCEYVGDSDQYAEYERLRLEQRTADERQEDLRIDQNMTIDAGLPGPWSAPWWWR
jgi:hypothetical protein